MGRFYRLLRKPCATCGASELEECIGLDSTSDNSVRRFHAPRRRNRRIAPRYKFIREEALKPPLYPRSKK